MTTSTIGSSKSKDRRFQKMIMLMQSRRLVILLLLKAKTCKMEVPKVLVKSVKKTEPN